MSVIECDSPESAFLALSKGLGAAVLVTAPVPATSWLTHREFVEQARDASPDLEIIFTTARFDEGSASPVRVHVLPGPVEAAMLSRFVRLVVARPTLRGTLQAQHRQARSLRRELGAR